MALNYSLNNFLLKAKQAFKNNNIRDDGRYSYINSSNNIYTYQIGRLFLSLQVVSFTSRVPTTII